MSLLKFIPITKVDAVKRLVFGVATAEVVDKANEIMDYEGTKPYYEKWSSDIAKASDGKSLGNVRAMHGKVAAGKLTDLVFNDDGKQIEICAKVVDDAEWEKVEEGVYTGFSQGGTYIRRWADPVHKGVTRYIADPVEVSLVDSPCVSTATFKLIKADGVAIEKSFQPAPIPADVVEPTNDQVIAKATELATAANDLDKLETYFDPARAELKKVAPPIEATPNHPAEDLQQVWKAKDGQTFSKKADAVAHNDKLKFDEANPLTAALSDLTKSIVAKEGVKVEPEAPAIVKVDEPAPKLRITKLWADVVAIPERLQKGMYTVSRLACLISELDWLQQDVLNEQMYEGDDSALPAKLKADVAALCLTLRAMVEEETQELIGDEPLIIEAAAGLFSDTNLSALRKAAGEKSEAVLAKIKALMPAPSPASDDQLEKLTTENAGLKKAIEAALPVITDLTERVNKLESQPAPPKGPTRVVEKAEDGLDQLMTLAAKDPEQAAMLLIKAAQQRPQVLFRTGPDAALQQ